MIFQKYFKQCITLIIIFFFSLNSLPISAQTFAQLDSAIKTTTQNDSLLAVLHVRKAFKIHRENPNELYKAIAILEQAVSIAKKGHLTKPQLTAYNKIGIIQSEQGNYNKAIEAYETCIALMQASLATASPEIKKKRERAILGLQGNIANVLSKQGKKDEALNVQLKIAANQKKLKNNDGEARALNNIANSYLKNGEYKKSIAYLIKAKKKSELDKYDRTTPYIYGNLSICYDELNMMDSSIYFGLLCKNSEHNDLELKLSNSALLAEKYAKIKDYKKSNSIYKELFSQFKNTSDFIDLGYYKLLAAESYIAQNDYEQAESLFNEAKKIKIGRLEHKQKLGEIGMLLKKHKKDYEEALKYQDIYQTATDSLNNVKRDSNFKDIETKYEVIKKEEKIEEQEVKLKNYSAGLVGLLALAIIAGLLFYYTKKQAVLKEQIAHQEAIAKEREIEELKKENKLISMQSMLEGQEEERKRIAQDLHDNIGTLMTSIKMKFLLIQKEIESIQKINIAGELDTMINSASQEVRRISHRMTPKILEHAGLHDSVMELETQLTENNIEVKSKLDALKSISDKKMELNIYRIIQEVYNNIIKHSSADKVSIVSNIEDSILTLRLRDNGKGMTKEKWDDKKTLGLNGIKSRVNYLNGEIKLVEDTGTHYRITIPIV